MLPFEMLGRALYKSLAQLVAANSYDTLSREMLRLRRPPVNLAIVLARYTLGTDSGQTPLPS